MRRLTPLAVLCLLLSCALLPAEYKIDGPTASPAYKIIRLKLVEDGKEPEKDTQVIWKLVGTGDAGQPLEADFDKFGYCLKFTGPPGLYKVDATVVNFTSKKIDSLEFKVRIGTVDPTPPGPGPGPGPTPPTPVDPAPIPLAGFRVMILYESSTAQKLPSTQQVILNGKKMRDFLDAKCVMGQDSKTREYRIWDKDVDASADFDHWETAVSDAMKKATADKKAFVPWIVVSNGKTGYSGPLPLTADETITLCSKYSN